VPILRDSLPMPEPEVAAMTAQELGLDYFQIYDAVNKAAAGSVLLRGAFDVRRQRMQLALLDHFATPVSPNGEPSVDMHAHLTWYRGVQPPEPIRAVVLENIFGKLKIRTGTGQGLLVPTQQMAQRSAFPNALDHYKVYRLADVLRVPETTLKLRDQFGESKVQVQVPQYFAVPVEKRHGTKAFEVQNTRAHLLIVGITVRDLEAKVPIRNQFDRRTSVEIGRTVMLAVPSAVRDWKPA
jgi:hypothetical protein